MLRVKSAGTMGLRLRLCELVLGRGAPLSTLLWGWQEADTAGSANLLAVPRGTIHKKFPWELVATMVFETGWAQHDSRLNVLFLGNISLWVTWPSQALLLAWIAASLSLKVSPFGRQSSPPPPETFTPDCSLCLKPEGFITNGMSCWCTWQCLARHRAH